MVMAKKNPIIPCIINTKAAGNPNIAKADQIKPPVNSCTNVQSNVIGNNTLSSGFSVDESPPIVLFENLFRVVAFPVTVLELSVLLKKFGWSVAVITLPSNGDNRLVPINVSTIKMPPLMQRMAM